MRYFVFWALISIMALSNVIGGILLAFFTPKKNILDVKFNHDSSYEFLNKIFGFSLMAIGGLEVALIIPIMQSFTVISYCMVVLLVFAFSMASLFVARYLAILVTKKMENTLK